MQSPPGREDMTEEERRQARDYLARYFGAQSISVFWGRSHEFAAELGRRWREAGNDG